MLALFIGPDGSRKIGGTLPFLFWWVVGVLLCWQLIKKADKLSWNLLMRYSDILPSLRAMVEDTYPSAASCALRAARSSGLGAGCLFGLYYLLEELQMIQPTQEEQLMSARAFQEEL